MRAGPKPDSSAAPATVAAAGTPAPAPASTATPTPTPAPAAPGADGRHWVSLGLAMARRPPAALALLALCYYVTARASLLLAFAHTNATPVWPPSGIALAAVLLMGQRAWPAILLGALAANLATFHANGLPLDGAVASASLLIATGNTLEAISGAWLLRRAIDAGQPLGQLQNVYKFTLVAMLMCVLSAAVGTGALVLCGLAPGSAFGTIMLTWWVGDTAGVLLVAPAIVVWLRQGAWSRPWRWSWAAALESALSLALLLGLIGAVFGSRYSAGDGLGWLPYLFVLCVAWASHRYGLRGASAVCLLAAGGAVLGTVNGHGPFAVGTLNDALIALESFVVLCSLVGMVLCADASEHQRLRAGARGHGLAQWATLLVGVGLTVVVWHLVSAATERRARERFDADCADLVQRITRRVALYESGLRSAQALFQALPEPSRAQWRDFAAGLDLRGSFPGMLGLGYGRYVPAAGRAALEAEARARGAPDFHLWTSEPALDPGMSAVVLYLEPFQGANMRVLGFDMMSEPLRRAALLQAARTGTPALSAKVTLVQDHSDREQAGFLMYFPIYRAQARLAADAGPEQHLAALQGFAYSPIRAADLMRDLLEPADHTLRMDIYDGGFATPAARLYSSADGDGAKGANAANADQYPNPYRSELPLEQLHHRWTLRFTSLPAFETTVDRQKSHIVLLAGAIISLLFFGVVRALTARQAYAVALAEDMTGALRESESSLIVARDLAEAASRAKSEFVANMSHEIRTPLNAVLGMSHLLGHTALSPDQQKYLEMIRSSGHSLLSILNDVLDFSKIEAGRMDLSPAPFQLSTVLEAIATIMTVNAGEKDLELAIGVEADVPQALLGDGHRLQQILTNLVGNAIKFTEKGAVSVLVELAPEQPPRRRRAIAGAPTALRFTVRDSGIGIPPDQLAQLFAPFSQADASMTRRFGGTGLGLAISRRMATLMGGAIEVRSVVGRGSEFALTVPLTRGAAGHAADVDADAVLDAVVAPPALVRHLLVIDDDAISAEYLCKTIRARGWSADYAHGGEQALAMLRESGVSYDAVLVDWNMPGMNGLATMQAIRAAAPQPAGPPSPSHPPPLMPIVLMVSAFGQGKLLHTDGAQTANAVLLKPVTTTRLGDTVQQAIGNAATRASATASAIMNAAPATATGGGLAVAGGGLNAAGVGGAAGDIADTGGTPPALRIDGVRILLVEDNPINQLVAKSMLAHAGASIDSVDNGRAALDVLRDGAERYDLVLMDVQMPEMDGFEATARIRSELGLTLPVLAMTAGVMLAEREQCIASGMNDFIAKPIDVEQMLRAIGRNLPPSSHADGR